ncbi:probable WRKY transcription factor 12 [Asparagus officinalis]|uniref:probable WRKY transcription factor 12 n=1 Tax=Asparagus officinalis TaxID=4686 RepID=UPI00098DEA95|nr:probable WRKY transcription factor 12 [Asparagus officinalis]
MEGVQDVQGEDQASRSDGSQITMPEDGHQWKKYGQKYIVRISKNRSYFKCRRSNCRVKKKVEWPPNDPSNMRIVYEGAHNHPPLSSSSDPDASGSNPDPNPYELRAQMFGQPNE